MMGREKALYEAYYSVLSCGHVWLVFIDDVTVDTINSEKYKAIFFAQIRPNALNPTEWCFMVQMDNDKYTLKATQGFFLKHRY